MNAARQPWIGKPIVDIIFILLPPFASLLVIFLFPGIFQSANGMSDISWIIIILLIDVAHVYSTLYRTYFDPNSFQKQRFLLTVIPAVGMVIGVLAYAMGSHIFWTLLAYTAVFHFVRQQYGFMRVYSRKETPNKINHAIDKITIYYATLYPLLYWHLKGQRNFNWFLEGDFLYVPAGKILPFFTALYFVVVGVYVVKEIISWVRLKYVNIPKLAIITGTLLSWYFGIVYFNGDMAFTLLNVVSHGIPYMALIWIYGQKNYTKEGKGSRFLKLVFSGRGLIIFLGIIFLLAFIEEGVWDLAVWKDHDGIFGSGRMPSVNGSEKLLTFLVPLLALPQITHYILDGFIWKIKHDEFKWKSER